MNDFIKQQKSNWLRSEIEKLEGMKGEGGLRLNTFKEGYKEGHNQALTSIITRYKEELLELDRNGV